MGGWQGSVGCWACQHTLGHKGILCAGGEGAAAVPRCGGERDSKETDPANRCHLQLHLPCSANVPQSHRFPCGKGKVTRLHPGI